MHAAIKFSQPYTLDNGLSRSAMMLDDSAVRVGTLVKPKPHVDSYRIVIDASFPEKFQRTFGGNGFTRKDVLARLDTLAVAAYDEVNAGTTRHEAEDIVGMEEIARADAADQSECARCAGEERPGFIFAFGHVDHGVCFECNPLHERCTTCAPAKKALKK